MARAPVSEATRRWQRPTGVAKITKSPGGFMERPMRIATPTEIPDDASSTLSVVNTPLVEDDGDSSGRNINAVGPKFIKADTDDDGDLEVDAEEEEASLQAEADGTGQRIGIWYHSDEEEGEPNDAEGSADANQSFGHAQPQPRYDIDDPKYQAHRNSLLLQHPQPRQGPTGRHQNKLESAAGVSYTASLESPRDQQHQVTFQSPDGSQLLIAPSGYRIDSAPHVYNGNDAFETNSITSRSSLDDNAVIFRLGHASAPSPPSPP